MFFAKKQTATGEEKAPREGNFPPAGVFFRSVIVLLFRYRRFFTFPCLLPHQSSCVKSDDCRV